MYNYRLTLKVTFFLFLSLLIFSSCSSKLVNIKPSEPKIINLEKNFIIEGKFQIQISSLKEKGNFILANKNNLLNIRLRHSPFLPEKVLFFNLKDEINLNELINEISITQENTATLSVQDLLNAIFGEKPIVANSKWNIAYPEGRKIISGFNIPSRITLQNGETNVLILVKQVNERN